MAMYDDETKEEFLEWMVMHHDKLKRLAERFEDGTDEPERYPFWLRVAANLAKDEDEES